MVAVGEELAAVPAPPQEAKDMTAKIRIAIKTSLFFFSPRASPIGNINPKGSSASPKPAFAATTFITGSLTTTELLKSEFWE